MSNTPSSSDTLICKTCEQEFTGATAESRLKAHCKANHQTKCTVTITEGTTPRKIEVQRVGTQFPCPYDWCPYSSNDPKTIQSHTKKCEPIEHDATLTIASDHGKATLVPEGDDILCEHPFPSSPRYSPADGIDPAPQTLRTSSHSTSSSTRQRTF